MRTEDESQIIVDFYRGGLPDNKSEKVVRIDFRSSEQVQALVNVFSGFAAGQRDTAEFSDLLPAVYRPSVLSFRLGLQPGQNRDHCVRVSIGKSGWSVIEWSAKREAWEDSVSLLRGMAEHSGRHQFLTSWPGGAEIVAAYYK